MGNLKEKRIRELTRAKFCPCCGYPMYIEHPKVTHKQTRTISRTYWVCSETLYCKHKELVETTTDKHIRLGLRDRALEILKMTDTDAD